MTKFNNMNNNNGRKCGCWWSPRDEKIAIVCGFVVVVDSPSLFVCWVVITTQQQQYDYY